MTSNIPNSSSNISIFSYLNSMQKLLEDSDADISYLTGKHIGVTKTKLNCNTKQNDPGMMDDGQKFEVENSGNAMASIELSREKLCQNKDNVENSVYFVIYRNEKLFDTDESDKKSRSKRSASNSDE